MFEASRVLKSRFWTLENTSEIDVDKVSQISGLDITFVTTAGTDEEALALLKAFGMPFVRPDAA